MNEKTKVMYHLARSYEYLLDIDEICSMYDYDLNKVTNSKISRHAVNMCLVQIGEHCGKIRDIDKEFYNSSRLYLYKIKGMRDRITHSYGHIDYDIIEKVLKEDIPYLRKYIEENINHEVLENPYVLYEMEYDDYIEEVNCSYDEPEL